MSRPFFSGMADNRPRFPYVLWQEFTDHMPYTCNHCNKEYPGGGKRYLGNLKNGMHQTAAVICPECRWNKVNKTASTPKRVPRKAESFTNGGKESD